MKRYVWGLVAFFCFLAVMAGLMPQRAELLEVQSRSTSLEAAVRLLEAERRRAPEDAAVAGRLARAYERVGEGARALDLLAAEGGRRALTPDERADVKRIALGLGQPARALPVLSGPRQALGRPERAELVAIALAAGRPATALVHQEAILALAPSDPAALAQARDLAAAVPALAKAVRYQGRLSGILKTPEAAEKLIALHLQAGDPAGALDALEASPLAKDPASWHRQAVELAGWARQPARAVPHLVALYDMAPERALGLTLARTLAIAGDVRALPFARRLYEADPDDPDAREHLLAMLARAGRSDQAKGLLLAARERRPHDAAAHRRLVDFLLGTGDRAGAAAMLARWVAAHPGDRGAMHRLAVVQVWDGRLDVAWTTYAKLLAGVSEAPEVAWRKEWLAISRPVDDVAPEGRENLAVLVEAEVDDPAVIRRAAAAAMESGDREEAIALGRRLLALPSATGEDALRLAEWLVWDRQFAEGFQLLRTLDAAAPLSADVLQDAADRAGAARRFADAAEFRGRLAQRRPKDPSAWEALAYAREAAGDILGAAAAWERRQALPGMDGPRRLQLAGLYMRLSRLEKASAVLGATVPELRLRSALAFELKRPQAQEAALAALVSRAPRDAGARQALAELLALRGAEAEARAQEDAAIALRPADAALLTAVAGRRLYGADPESAGQVVERLMAMADPGAAAWRVIADYAQPRSPERAAAALDRLHAAGGGDAETYYRRGELAAAALAGAVAEEAYMQAARRGEKAQAPAMREAGAYALERLGRPRAARAAWQGLLRDHPRRPAAYAALAREAIAGGDLAAADRLLAAAPEDAGVALARAEWLRASGRDAEAAEALSALRVRDASPYLVVAEAMARQGAGQHGRARAIVLSALELSPDPALRSAHRLLREKGASRAGFSFFQERYAALDRTRVGVSSAQRLGDRVRLDADLARLAWDGGRLSVNELGLGLTAADGPLEAAGRIAVPVGQAPLGEVALGYARGAIAGRVGLAEARWEETSAVATAGGRERKLALEAGWQPDARVFVRAHGTIGQLSLGGQAVGLATTGVAEATVRPDAASPFFAAYQYRHRAWGEAGPKAGLPAQLATHAASVGWGAQLGPVRVEVQPGAVHDGTAIAPMVGGAVALEMGPDQEFAVSGLWSGRAANVGGAGRYETVSVTGRWWF